MSDKDQNQYRDRDHGRDSDRDHYEDRQKDYGWTPGRTEENTLPDRDSPPSRGR